MREALGRFDLERIVPGIAQRRPQRCKPGIELREGSQRLRDGCVQRKSWERQLVLKTARCRRADRGAKDCKIGRIVEAEAETRQAFFGQIVVINETAVGQPDRAIADVRGFDKEIRNDFALQADAPLVLSARSSGVLVDHVRWPATDGIHA